MGLSWRPNPSQKKFSVKMNSRVLINTPRPHHTLGLIGRRHLHHPKVMYYRITYNTGGHGDACIKVTASNLPHTRHFHSDDLAVLSSHQYCVTISSTELPGCRNTIGHLHVQIQQPQSACGWLLLIQSGTHRDRTMAYLAAMKEKLLTSRRVH